MTCLDGGAIYTCVPAHLQHVAGELLRDEEWLDNVFFPTNLARLRESYELVVDSLKSLGVPVYRAKVLQFLSFNDYLIHHFIFFIRLDCLFGLISVLI